MNAKREKICDPCRFTNKHITADYFCQNCMEYYCKHCRKQHLKFRLTMGHTVGKWKETENVLSTKVSTRDICQKNGPERYCSNRVEPDIGNLS